ncbi:BZ3500_MvSof-1268-A1-R1_C038g00050 [Microbotryum saponariae]|uniref:BZ3500_MvSof-1268-A1-R1_C038g00050 protein n=1 Tax=Microbotryum saponariae TaxID=289078 RepID=A0A2X0L9A8_9BASI|nr:BZ3500_MvSof-1268-A1-R1_C038g00050 [Microbotryum saponariae]SDA06496.1 BZ3501_MvSof-1269-A2-R1_Chr4-1g06541 [Microbotryum saponariae]
MLTTELWKVRVATTRATVGSSTWLGCCKVPLRLRLMTTSSQPLRPHACPRAWRRRVS